MGEGGSGQPIIRPNFPENCIKMKKIWSRGPYINNFYYVDPSLSIIAFWSVQKIGVHHFPLRKSQTECVSYNAVSLFNTYFKDCNRKQRKKFTYCNKILYTLLASPLHYPGHTKERSGHKHQNYGHRNIHLLLLNNRRYLHISRKKLKWQQAPVEDPCLWKDIRRKIIELGRVVNYWPDCKYECN